MMKMPKNYNLSNVGFSHLLEEALQLENNQECFMRLKKDMWLILERLFDLNYSASGQKQSAIKSLENNLKEEYPDFFNGKKNELALQYAIMYLKQFHNRRHKRYRTTKDGSGGKSRRHRASTALSSASRQRSVSAQENEIPSANQDTTVKKEKEKKTNDSSPTTTASTASQQGPAASASAPVAQKRPLIERMAANLAFFSNSDAEGPKKTTTQMDLAAGQEGPSSRSLRGENNPRRTEGASAPVRRPTTTTAPVARSVSRFVPYSKPSSPASPPASTHSASEKDASHTRTQTQTQMRPQTQLSPPGCAQPAARGFHNFGSKISQSTSSSSTPSTLCPSPSSTPSGSPCARSTAPGPPLAIDGLLSSCIPSMIHLLDRFIAFGCTSEECLLAVSTWKPEQIELFIERVAEGGGAGAALSPMEKMVLLNRFMNFFL